MKDLPNESAEEKLGLSFEEFCDLLDQIEGKKKVVDEANGGLRSHIKSTLEAKSWNKSGLAMIRALRAMSATQRADVIRTFEPMFNLLMERKWRSELVDLAGERAAPEGDED